MDFLFAAGGDRPDEDVFERMRDGAWTVHVGPGFICAAFVVAAFEGVRCLLGILAEAGT